MKQTKWLLGGVLSAAMFAQINVHVVDQSLPRAQPHRLRCLLHRRLQTLLQKETQHRQYVLSVRLVLQLSLLTTIIMWLHQRLQTVLSVDRYQLRRQASVYSRIRWLLQPTITSSLFMVRLCR